MTKIDPRTQATIDILSGMGWSIKITYRDDGIYVGWVWHIMATKAAEVIVIVHRDLDVAIHKLSQKIP